MELNTYVKSEIELRTCPVHHKHPSVQIIDNNFDVLCCCVQFRISCLRGVVNLLIEKEHFKQKVA